MEPVIVVGGARVFAGDCREALKHLPDNSVDSVVTYPPYELWFMGKSWDSSGIAYDPAVWAECLRVLKPGGHILAFGGSRTWHRLAVAVEDAGFELRDSIAWIYGSGFPKSLDVSKAIDRNNGEGGKKLKFTRWMRTTGLKVSEATRVLREARLISENGTMAGHFFAESNAGQPAIPTAELWAALRPHCGDVPAWVDELVARVEAEREVIGQRVTGAAMSKKTSGLDAGTGGTDFGSGQNLVDETAPATSEAKTWQGWGTALKPAFEPVVVGRKPFGKGVTVAENVLAWGVGGLNIDGSRIASPDGVPTFHQKGQDSVGIYGNGLHGSTATGERDYATGRWPANVILDEVTAGLLDEQSGVSKPKPARTGRKGGNGGALGEFAGSSPDAIGVWPEDVGGGASRFFYVAKASRRDRNEGLEELEARSAAEMTGRKEGSAGLVMKHVDGSDKANAYAGTTGSARQNFHPTVKPTALMRYLIKLVTPEGGVVLDPFTGSGSTGKAALLDGFQFVGVELTEEYLPIIQGRLRWASEQVEDDGTLF